MRATKVGWRKENCILIEEKTNNNIPLKNTEGIAFAV